MQTCRPTAPKSAPVPSLRLAGASAWMVKGGEIGGFGGG